MISNMKATIQRQQSVHVSKYVSVFKYASIHLLPHGLVLPRVLRRDVLYVGGGDSDVSENFVHHSLNLKDGR